MEKKLAFLVNGKEIGVEAWPGRPALDFIRDDLGLKGAKEGCREGDCGACAVLVGARAPLQYRATPSCLLALGELDGRHLVTIEGLAEGAAAAGLEGGCTPVMRALLAENGSQCGFCSPGVVISLTAWLLSSAIIDEAGAIVAVEGNLCRCTGYGAIRRAGARLAAEFAGLPPPGAERLAALEKAGVVPLSLGRFSRGELLAEARPVAPNALGETGARGRGLGPGELAQGGGTDFYVRNTDPEGGFEPVFTGRNPAYTGIEAAGGGLRIGAGTRVSDFFASPLVRSLVPGIEAFEADVASSLVRGRATLGGNVANASPVGDLTAILLALGARAELEGSGGGRELPLDRLFLGYKKLDLREGELIAAFTLGPRPGARFNFEKVSKRRSLDIASVNTAASFATEKDGNQIRITCATISAGGVGPTPMLLTRAQSWLAGRTVSVDTAREAAAMAAEEIAPISDVRGSADYRKRLLERLVLAHFIRLFPGEKLAEELFR
jgi:xanthine dehydrogenase small subunit